MQGLAYVAGGALLGAGAYLLMRGFPDWWLDRMRWPLVDVTSSVTRLQAFAAIGLGLSILAIGFTPIVPVIAGGALVLAALVAYLAAAALFLYSVWLSRRSVS